jgi:cell division transport system permease protein
MLKINKPKGILVIFTFVLVYFLASVLGFILLKIADFTDYLDENTVILVFFEETLNDDSANQILEHISAHKFVKKTNFINKKEVLSEFKRNLGEEFVAILGDNPIGAYAQIYTKPAYNQPNKLKSFQEEISQIPSIVEVNYQPDIISEIERNRALISKWLIIVTICLAFISTGLVVNTIRLSIYADRFLIRNMQLVGARFPFIWRPYLKKSFIWNTIGFVVGVGAALLSIWILMKYVSTITDMGQAKSLIIGGLKNLSFFSLLFSMFIAGFVINLLATYWTTKKYITMSQDNLNK